MDGIKVKAVCNKPHDYGVTGDKKTFWKNQMYEIEVQNNAGTIEVVHDNVFASYTSILHFLECWNFISHVK